MVVVEPDQDAFPWFSLWRRNGRGRDALRGNCLGDAGNGSGFALFANPSEQLRVSAWPYAGTHPGDSWSYRVRPALPANAAANRPASGTSHVVRATRRGD